MRKAAAGGARPGGGGGGGRVRPAGGPPQPGNLITGAWGEQALTPDSRGWGWMVKSYLANAQRPLYNQAKEKLLQDKQVTSVTISTFNPEQYCESQKALGLHLVRDAAQHAVVQRSAEDDCRLPGSWWRRSDDPHAGRTRSEHSEGDGPRRARHHRSDG